MKPVLRCAALLLPTLVGSPALAADTFGDAIAGGKANLDLRYRFENVDDEQKTRDADASTLRTRVRYTTGTWNDASAQVEMDNVSLVGDSHYFDLRNGNFTYPAVYDPVGTDLNQGWVRYAGIKHTTLTVGRQTLGLDNQRFIGMAPWRQHEQSYDAATLETHPTEKLAATWIYVEHFHTSLGPNDAPGMPPAAYNMHSHLLNFKYTVAPAFTVTGYYYALDFTDQPGNSGATGGLRLTGELPAGDLKAGYTLEGARQDDYANRPESFSAPYAFAELRLDGQVFGISAAFERLGVDNGTVFETPLATRKFHGLAERFFMTPQAGIRDGWLRAAAHRDGYGLELVVHDMYTGDGSAHYGNEIDVQLTRAFGKRYLVLLQYADYHADHSDVPMLGGWLGANDDICKTWVMLQAKF